jgi:hypothetical protein
MNDPQATEAQGMPVASGYRRGDLNAFRNFEADLKGVWRNEAKNPSLSAIVMTSVQNLYSLPYKIILNQKWS